MSLEDIYYVSQIVAAVPIVASLIFVGLQTRQNTRAVRAAASQAYAANRAQLNSNIVTVGEFAQIWRKGVAAPDSLSDDEHVRFLVHMTTLFLTHEAARIQWRHGQLDSEHWDNVVLQLRDAVDLPGFQRYWKIRGHWHSPEFRNWYQSLTSASPGHGLYDRQWLHQDVEPQPNAV
jgi:hypothetical protein